MSEIITDYKAVLQMLKQKKYYPVYLLHGEEPYFIDLISHYIEQEVLTEAEKAFNLNIFYGKDANPQSIMEAAMRYPVMASHQVVILREAQDMKELGALDSYLKRASPSTLLVICHKYKKLEKHSVITGALKDIPSLIFESKPVSDYQIPEWIKAYLKSKNLTATGDALFLIGESLGNDLGKITNELDKLMMNLPDQAQITLRDVEEYIGISKEYNVFALITALAHSDSTKAFRIAAYFRQNPKYNPMPMVMSVLYGFFSKLYIYQSMWEKSRLNGTSPASSDLMKALGFSQEYRLKEYKSAASFYSRRKVMDILGWLKNCDLKSKGVGSNFSHAELLDELLIRILGERAK